VKRLSPRHQVKNPVMFVVWLGSLLTTGLFIQALAGQGEAPAGFILAITLWLWFTVLFANFAEAVAEGRGKAQAAALKGMRRTVMAKKLKEPRHDAPPTWSTRKTCAGATWCWSPPARPSPATAR
jgi:K+-transporting ATPase ATPase B chain